MKRIGWDVFARIRAKLDAGLEREAVLAEAGVDAETWFSDHEALLAELADDVERADLTRLAAYRAAYQTAWAELAALATTDAPPADIVASEQPGSQSSPDPIPHIEVQQASFQRAAVVAPWPAAAPPGPSLVGSVSDEAPADGTLLLRGVIDMDPLPFQLASAPHLAACQDDATLPLQGLVNMDPLPFQVAMPQRVPPRQNGDSDHSPPPPLAQEPAPSSSEFAEITLGPTSPPASSALPFQTPSALTRLTLEQYACLCAELSVFPQHVEAIFRKYGLISLRERLTVDIAWQERLRRDPTEHAAWQGLYRRYQAYWIHTANHH
ncbi:hypothetical protein ACSRUE_19950 [Sorangium sp. KYC3313]|uniref:hypothetical protein n=1 Tax=Sorangium sp. KYC3313 TaxID=3449740 RepID=UPI003F8965EE